jgi:hypothetical protein
VYPPRVLPLHDTDFYTAPDRASVLVSSLTVAFAGIIAIPALLAFAFARRRDALLHAAAEVAAEAGADTRALRPGRTVLHGEVLGEMGALCVSVRIEQAGRVYQVKSGLRHKWTEVSRVVEARPFTLRLASGEDVEVLPDNDVLLVDWLGVEERANRSHRVRVAELRPRAKVYVEGELVPPPPGDAYRGGRARFTMRAARGARLVVSVERLEERFQARARVHSIWTLGLAATLVLLHVVAFGWFWRASAFGDVQSAHVTDVRTWKTSSKGGPTIHYAVLATVDGDTAPHAAYEVSANAYMEAQSMAPDAQVPFVVVSGTEARAVGTRPTLAASLCIFVWALVALLPLGYWAWVAHRRPWYERTRIVDEGEGPLGGPDALV